MSNLPMIIKPPALVLKLNSKYSTVEEVVKNVIFPLGLVAKLNICTKSQKETIIDSLSIYGINLVED